MTSSGECVLPEAGENGPGMTVSTAVDLAFALVHALLLLCMFADRCCHPRRSWGASPRYGLQPKSLLKFLCWMGLLVSGTPVRAIWILLLAVARVSQGLWSGDRAAGLRRSSQCVGGTITMRGGRCVRWATALCGQWVGDAAAPTSGLTVVCVIALRLLPVFPDCAANQVVLYYFFWCTRHVYGWAPSLVCQSQYSSTGVPLLAAFFTVFAGLLASAVCYRRRTVHTAVQSIPMEGCEDVVLFPARRGLMASALAMRLTEGGHVTCVDQWNLHPSSETGEQAVGVAAVAWRV